MLWLCVAQAHRAVAREVNVLDLFYIAIVLLFFGLLWGFTKAAEKL